MSITKAETPDIDKKIYLEIETKNDSGNNCISKLSSGKLRFHCGNNNSWKRLNADPKSKTIKLIKSNINDNETSDQKINQFKIIEYLDMKIKNILRPTNKNNDIRNTR